MDKKFRKPVSEIFLPEILDGEGDIIPIIADGDDGDLEDVEVPETILVAVRQHRRAVPHRRDQWRRGFRFQVEAVQPALAVEDQGFAIPCPVGCFEHMLSAINDSPVAARHGRDLRLAVEIVVVAAIGVRRRVVERDLGGVGLADRPSEPAGAALGWMVRHRHSR